MPPDLPYTNLSRWLKKRFGAPVFRVPLDAGFSCPNRDGTIGTAGCAFCSPASFSGPADARLPVREQLDRAIAARRRRNPSALFIAYFQPGTNTHGPRERLLEALGAVSRPEVAAISVGTRPDCAGEEVLDLLAGFAAEREVWVEFGVQSSCDETLRRVARGHSFAAFEDAAQRAFRKGLSVIAHVILGLPGEGPAQVARTALDLASTPLAGVKLHHLYVARGTALEASFRAGDFEPPSESEHVRLAVDFLERIPEGVVVHRLVSDPEPSLLVAPRWRLSKQQVLGKIVEEFRRRGTRQGALAGPGGARSTEFQGPRPQSKDH